MVVGGRAPSLGDHRRSLTIGTRVGGLDATTRPVAELTRRLSNTVHAFEDAYTGSDPDPEAEAEAEVNVIFDVPGPVIAPDYTGVQTGVWSAKNRRQIVVVAVPVADTPFDALPRFLADALVRAVAVAADAMAKRKTQYPLDRASAIAEGAAEVFARG
jgi:hypothetical protein